MNSVPHNESHLLKKTKQNIASVATDELQMAVKLCAKLSWSSAAQKTCRSSVCFPFRLPCYSAVYSVQARGLEWHVTQRHTKVHELQTFPLKNHTLSSTASCQGWQPLYNLLPIFFLIKNSFKIVVWGITYFNNLWERHQTERDLLCHLRWYCPGNWSYCLYCINILQTLYFKRAKTCQGSRVIKMWSVWIIQGEMVKKLKEWGLGHNNSGGEIYIHIFLKN